MANLSNTVQTAIAEGRYAFRVGESEQDNPYPLTHEYGLAWLSGWKAAHTQYNGKSTLHSEKNYVQAQ